MERSSKKLGDQGLGNGKHSPLWPISNLLSALPMPVWHPWSNHGYEQSATAYLAHRLNSRSTENVNSYSNSFKSLLPSIHLFLFFPQPSPEYPSVKKKDGSYPSPSGVTSLRITSGQPLTVPLGCWAVLTQPHPPLQRPRHHSEFGFAGLIVSAKSL